MSKEIAIKIENISKAYSLYDSHVDRMKEALSPLRRKYHHTFNALHNISLEIKKGEAVGIIGKNGSGKSTLLKIITGVLTPTMGSVVVNGKVSALLELGAGFNPELTGLENVYFNGMLMDYSREQMDENLDEILAFADIGEFIHQPVKTYSSGMFLRLAFAVAVNVKPDILVVDEALSVGDVFFQQKCFSKIREILSSNVTLLFVSHDMSAFQNICNRGVLLKEGIKVLDGRPIDCASEYFVNSKSIEKGMQNTAINNDNDIAIINKLSRLDVIKNSILVQSSTQQGDRLLEIVAVEFQNQSGSGYSVEFGEFIVVKVLFRANDFIIAPNIGFNLFDRMNNLLFSTSAYLMNHVLRPMKPADEDIISFKVYMNIKNGEYTFAVGASTININNCSESSVHHRWLDLGPIRVVNNSGRPSINGMVQLPCELLSSTNK